LVKFPEEFDMILNDPTSGVRLERVGSVLALSGYAARFDADSHVHPKGHRMRFARDAFDHGVDTTALEVRYRHDPRIALGRLEDGTARIFIDEHGLFYQCLLDDRDERTRLVVNKILAGEIRGSSLQFGYHPACSGWDKRGRIPVQEVHYVSAVFDVGPGDDPAFPATCTWPAAGRSTERRAIKPPERLIDMSRDKRPCKQCGGKATVFTLDYAICGKCAARNQTREMDKRASRGERSPAVSYAALSHGGRLTADDRRKDYERACSRVMAS
jgi:phage head maturation protease